MGKFVGMRQNQVGVYENELSKKTGLLNLTRIMNLRIGG